MTESAKRNEHGPDSAGEDGPSAQPAKQSEAAAKARPPEIGGPQGPEPTRYGDWERNGRCSDF